MNNISPNLLNVLTNIQEQYPRVPVQFEGSDFDDDLIIGVEGEPPHIVQDEEVAENRLRTALFPYARTVSAYSYYDWEEEGEESRFKVTVLGRRAVDIYRRLIAIGFIPNTVWVPHPDFPTGVTVAIYLNN